MRFSRIAVCADSECEEVVNVRENECPRCGGRSFFVPATY
jgi:RNA polymerase subunit RPABC4/transcription elongation factor Spt4